VADCVDNVPNVNKIVIREEFVVGEIGFRVLGFMSLLMCFGSPIRRQIISEEVLPLVVHSYNTFTFSRL